MLELKEYYIILESEQLEFGIGIKKFVDTYGATDHGHLVVMTTNNKEWYDSVFNWLSKKYYWREHNSCFSHHNLDKQAEWLIIENNCVVSKVN